MTRVQNTGAACPPPMPQFGDPQLELAAMVIQSQNQQEADDHEDLVEAHHDVDAAHDREIAGLQDEASSAMTGAIVGAGLTIAGSAASMYAASKEIHAADFRADQAGQQVSARVVSDDATMKRLQGQAHLWQAGGGAATAVAPTVDKVISNQAGHRRDQAQARKDADDAQYRLDNARSHADQTSKHIDSMIDTARDLIRTRGDAKGQIIRNM